MSNKQTDNHSREIRQCLVIVIGAVSCLASLHTHLWRLFTLFISRIHKSKTELMNRVMKMNQMSEARGKILIHKTKKSIPGRNKTRPCHHNGSNTP